MHLAILANAANYHLHRWLPALAEKNVRISLLSFVEPAEPLPKVDFRLLDRPTGRLFRHSLADFLLAAGTVRSLLEGLSPDVLLGSYATNYGFLGARTGIRPYVLQTWTADVQLYPVNGLKRFVLGPMVRYALRAADLVTTDGPALREVVLSSFPHCANKTESILWGVDLENYLDLSSYRLRSRVNLGIPPDAIVITTARGLRFHDRPEIFLPALREVLESHEEAFGVVLCLGGEPEAKVAPMLEALRRHARCLVIDRFLDSEAVREVWSASDFVISVPLFDGISETVLEAMAAGCVPILSDIAPNRIIVPDSENAIFTPADSPAALAADIHAGLKKLDRLRQSAVPANRKWVQENASIENTATRLANLITGLVERRTND